jgi:hypothetical protein
MPRANRHFIPGYVWHITYRCHKKKFLMEKLDIKAKGREAVEVNGRYHLKEPVISYKPILEHLQIEWVKIRGFCS